ncbi:hypothetical protein FB451DRAFT_1162063 [Mycena latifolia]|nr:hypothetical protein FB451DRAFT_1162063 [Mycena latifolia]
MAQEVAASPTTEAGTDDEGVRGLEREHTHVHNAQRPGRTTRAGAAQRGVVCVTRKRTAPTVQPLLRLRVLCRQSSGVSETMSRSHSPVPALSDRCLDAAVNIALDVAVNSVDGMSHGQQEKSKNSEGSPSLSYLFGRFSSTEVSLLCMKLGVSLFASQAEGAQDSGGWRREIPPSGMPHEIVLLVGIPVRGRYLEVNLF